VTQVLSVAESIALTFPCGNLVAFLRPFPSLSRRISIRISSPGQQGKFPVFDSYSIVSTVAAPTAMHCDSPTMSQDIGSTEPWLGSKIIQAFPVCHVPCQAQAPSPALAGKIIKMFSALFFAPAFVSFPDFFS
jgi:hypothetical protein